MRIRCLACDGHGFKYDLSPFDACHECAGAGVVEWKVAPPVPPAVQDFLLARGGACHRCIGTGRIFSMLEGKTIACPVCQPKRLPDGSLFMPAMHADITADQFDTFKPARDIQ